jgi:hypothetical protein
MTELPEHARTLLAAARLERTPSARDRERVLASLLAGAALTTTSSAAAAPSLLAKLSGGLGKWWLLGGLCTAMVGGGYWVSAGGGSTGAPPAETLPGALRAAPAKVEAEAPPSLPPVEPVAPAPVPAPAPAHAPAKRDIGHPTFEQELAQLHAAHAAYREGRSAQALQLIRQHQARFPGSQLTGERVTLEVLTLCRLGREDEARRLADRLRARGAATLSGLDGSCAASTTK